MSLWMWAFVRLMLWIVMRSCAEIEFRCDQEPMSERVCRSHPCGGTEILRSDWIQIATYSFLSFGFCLVSILGVWAGRKCAWFAAHLVCPSRMCRPGVPLLCVHLKYAGLFILLVCSEYTGLFILFVCLFGVREPDHLVLFLGPEHADLFLHHSCWDDFDHQSNVHYTLESGWLFFWFWKKQVDCCPRACRNGRNRKMIPICTPVPWTHFLISRSAGWFFQWSMPRWSASETSGCWADIQGNWVT